MAVCFEVLIGVVPDVDSESFVLLALNWRGKAKLLVRWQVLTFATVSSPPVRVRMNVQSMVAPET